MTNTTQSVPSSSTSSREVLPSARIDVHAGEYSPAYPALFAGAFGTDRREHVALRVHALGSRGDVLRELAAGGPTLALLPASLAVCAIARGLAAKIVCAAVAPVDLAHLDQEPPVAWERFATGVRRVPPRAVLVAPRAVLVRDPAGVESAIRSYWRAAALAAEAPTLLGVALATEFGLAPLVAETTARAAIATWRMDPAVRLAGLRLVVTTLFARGELTRTIDAEALLDERFVRADRTEVWGALGA